MKIHQLGTDWRWMLVFYHRRPLELDTDGIWCVLPASFPENFQVHLRKMWGVEKNCKNAFKCNLKELTTKKAYSASGPRSVTMHLPSSSPHLSCNSWSMACGVSFAQHYPVIRFFFQLIFPPSFSPYSFFTDIFQCDGCLVRFLFLWGLLAGLFYCGSHGGIIQTRGWPPKGEAPRYPRCPTSYWQCSCYM